ncbi:coiled-coil domain-containing protein 57 [Talpa occidentalis]|uniref:coiled-coil domain-containing protein 57 n=1 Tax=Talpa occidentalis TaxID=50954 RepID=UPI0023F8BDF2|nr:coiled-coil domain-containing protein 57 [Talpa occidentalis]
MPPPSQPPLSELLARKEEEWRALRDSQAQLQEAALRDAQAQLQEARGQLRALQEDFIYNLRLLEERDRELELRDAAVARARALEEARQAELSELRVQVAKLQQALAREAQRTEALQRQQRLTWQKHQLDLDRLHSAGAGELAQQRARCEDLRRRLERRLEALDGDLALQRQELLQEFEAELRRRELEAGQQARSMSGEVLARELEVKALSRELAALEEARARAAETARGSEGARAELEQELRRREQALQDLAAAKDTRIRDLEARLQALLLATRGEQETLRSRHEELDRLARERDVALAAARGAQAEQLQTLEAGARELQARCEALEAQLRGAAGRQADAAREKDALIKRLREDASALKSGWDAQVAQLSQEMVSKDLQAQALREEAASLRAQLAQSQQDVARYGQQLALAAGREQSLQRDKAQLELDWQRRCDGVERDLHRRAEGLVQALSAARDQVAAKLEETERRLRDQEVVLKDLARERDQALQALRTPRPLPEAGEAQALPGRQDGDPGAAALPSSEVQRLQEQNASLRGAVAQMRREMEALSGQALPPQRPPAPPPALAAEIRSLKHRLKSLEEQLGRVLGPAETSPPAAGPAPAPAPPAAAGAAEPASAAPLGRALRRLDARAGLLSRLLVQLQQQVRREPLDLGAVRRELPREVDQVQLEVMELREQVAELQRHLGTAGGAPGTEALLGPPAPTRPARPIPQLQRKLKEASREILRLRQEREQLLELGNRLRAERGRPAGEDLHPGPCLAAVGSPQVPRPLGLGLAGAAAFPGRAVAGSRRQRVPGGHPDGRRPRTPAWALAPGQGPPPRPSPPTAAPDGAPPQGRPPPASQGRPEDHDHHTRRPPSLAGSALQDTWKLLDLGSSPPGLSSQEDAAAECEVPPAADPPQPPAGSAACPGGAFTIRGTKVEAQARARPARTSGARPARTQHCQRPPRIRNYNLKD